MTHEPEPDPLARLLRPLTDEQWQLHEHRERLCEELERRPRPRSRLTLFWSALAGGVLVALLLAATGGVQFLQRLFGIEVVEVERDLAGKVQRITVRTDEDTQLQLQPLQRDREFDEPVIVTLARRGGGEVRVRVLRDAGLDVLPKFVPVSGTEFELVPGARYALREVPCPWSVTVTAQALTLHATNGDRSEVLPRVVTPAGSLARYGDLRGLLEVEDP